MTPRLNLSTSRTRRTQFRSVTSRTDINGYLDREVEKIRIISFFNRNLEFRIRTNMSVIFHGDNDARAFHALYDADNGQGDVLLQRRASRDTA